MPSRFDSFVGGLVSQDSDIADLDGRKILANSSWACPRKDKEEEEGVQSKELLHKHTITMRIICDSHRSSVVAWLGLWLCLAIIRASAETVFRVDDDNEPFCVCQVAQTSMLLQDVTGKRTSQHVFDCLVLDDDDDEEEEDSSFRLPMTVNSDLYQTHQAAMSMGDWWIQFPCAWNKRPPVVATREMYQQIQSLSATQVKQAWTASQQGRLLHGPPADDVDAYPKYLPHHERRLSNVGIQSCAIIIIDALDVTNALTADVADRALYGQTSAQFAACSAGALRLSPGDDTIRVPLPANIGAYDNTNITTAIFRAACAAYGYAPTCHLAALRGVDHVLFSLPYGLQNDKEGSYWAFASTGDYRRFAVFSGGEYLGGQAGFFIPSTLLHE